MSEFKWTIIVFFLCSFDHLSAQTNPCPKYWRYVQQADNFEGRLTILNPSTNGNLKVKLVLSITGYLPNDYEGSIKLLTDEKTAQNERKLEYQVHLPIQNPLPVPFDISVNDKSICRSHKPLGTITTNVKLIYTLNQRNKTSSALAIPSLYPTEPPSAPSNDVCGVAYEAAGQSLAVNGNTYRRGRFPWLSALFFKNKFICAGTLVSRNHVITAAHCIHNKHDHRQRYREMHFVLGAHNLNAPNLAIQKISTFITHPDWDPDSEVYDADIAVAVFSYSVKFTDFIRPACLFTPGLHNENINNRVGTLAGWGRTENNEFATDNPRMISILVVSDSDCLKSNPLFARVSSHRTFCAGSPGKGPCEGDAGGGLLIQTNGKWVLRGIISGSLKGNGQSCDVDEFAVFTNVAKYDSWIRSYIE